MVEQSALAHMGVCCSTHVPPEEKTESPECNEKVELEYNEETRAATVVQRSAQVPQRLPPSPAFSRRAAGCRYCRGRLSRTEKIVYPADHGTLPFDIAAGGSEQGNAPSSDSSEGHCVLIQSRVRGHLSRRSAAVPAQVLNNNLDSHPGEIAGATDAIGEASSSPSWAMGDEVATGGLATRAHASMTAAMPRV